MRPVFALVSLTMAVTGCGTEEPDPAYRLNGAPTSPGSGDERPSGGSAPPTEAAPGIGSDPSSGEAPGGGDSIPIVRQRSLFDGTTSVDVLPRVSFGANWITPKTADAAIANLSSRAAFSDAQGSSIDAVVDGEPITDPYESWHYALWISPAKPLEADTWYWLTITHDPNLPVWDAINRDGVAADPETFYSRFFTGSAPTVLRVVHEVGGSLYQVFLSEPIGVGTAVGRVSVHSGAAPVTGCVWWLDSCISDQTPLLNSGFDFRADVRQNTVATAMRLGGTIQGSGRTVLEGAMVAGGVLAEDGKDVEVLLGEDAWGPCTSSNGTALCWNAEKVPPPGF